MSFAVALNELGLSVEDQQPLTLKERETLYAAAYGIYEVGDYERAADLFTQLILNEPFELRFWNGLASSRQMQKDYRAALHAWSIVCLLGGHQPVSHFHAAECYLSLGELQEAAKALECAKFYLKSNPGPLSQKIKELTKVIANG